MLTTTICETPLMKRSRRSTFIWITFAVIAFVLLAVAMASVLADIAKASESQDRVCRVENQTLGYLVASQYPNDIPNYKEGFPFVHGDSCEQAIVVYDHIGGGRLRYKLDCFRTSTMRGNGHVVSRSSISCHR
jgi:hypothetical protein